MFRDDDDANDDPDYQQPASVSQKDDDMEDEDDKVTVHTGITIPILQSVIRTLALSETWWFILTYCETVVISLILMVGSTEETSILILR